MNTRITYDPKTRAVEEESNPQDRRFMIHVFGEETWGFLAEVTFGGAYRTLASLTNNPRKAKYMDCDTVVQTYASLRRNSIVCNVFSLLQNRVMDHDLVYDETAGSIQEISPVQKYSRRNTDRCMVFVFDEQLRGYLQTFAIIRGKPSIVTVDDPRRATRMPLNEAEKKRNRLSEIGVECDVHSLVQIVGI